MHSAFSTWVDTFRGAAEMYRLSHNPRKREIAVKRADGNSSVASSRLLTATEVAKRVFRLRLWRSGGVKERVRSTRRSAATVCDIDSVTLTVGLRSV